MHSKFRIMKTNKMIIVAAALWMMTLTACNSLLDQKPYGSFTEDQMDENSVEGLLASAYAGLEAYFFISDNNCAFAGPSTNWIFDVRSDDALKGGGGVGMEGNIHQLEVSNIFSDNVSIKWKWLNNYYALARVHRAMKTIRNLNVENQNQYLGELKTLRAFFYFDLVRIFKYLPYITEDDDPSTVDNSTYTQADIYGFIQQDLREAYSLMDIDEPAPGRFNKFAAAALMAKVCAFTQEWDSVIVYADHVITSNRYQLYPNYLDMNKIDFNNSYESIIAMQCSTADDYAHYNRSNLLNITYSAGNLYGTGDDFFYGSQNLVDAFRTTADGLPFLEDNAPAEHVSATYSGTLDPRLEFTVGRIGFPFRGYTYTDKWCRTPDVYGEYSNKKCCSDPNDTRVSKDWPWGGSPLNFCFLRYADLLLLKAEACVEKNELGMATNLVNEIRLKAQRSIDADYQPEDINPELANYNIQPYPEFTSQEYARKAVRMERRLELAMEGHRWFDLVRWGEAVNTMNAYFQSEAQFHNYYSEANMTEDELFFPTPYEEVLNANGLYK